MTKLKMREVYELLEVNWVIDLVPEALWIYKQTYKMKPKYLTIHNAAFQGPGKNLHSYNKTCCLDPNLQMLKFWHLSIGLRIVWQAGSFGRNAWHAGDGRGPGNMESIAMEIPYDLPLDNPDYQVAEDTGARVAAAVLYQFGWTTERMRTHYDWSGKYCPHRILPYWNAFKKKTDKYLQQIKKAEKKKVKEEKPTKPSIPEPKRYIYRIQMYPRTSRSAAMHDQQLARKAGFISAWPRLEDGLWRTQIAATYNSSDVALLVRKATRKNLRVIVRRVEDAPQKVEVKAA